MIPTLVKWENLPKPELTLQNRTVSTWVPIKPVKDRLRWSKNACTFSFVKPVAPPAIVIPENPSRTFQGFLAQSPHFRIALECLRSALGRAHEEGDEKGGKQQAEPKEKPQIAISFPSS